MNFKKIIMALAITIGLSLASFSYASDPTVAELEAKIAQLKDQIAKLMLVIQNRNALNAGSDSVSISICKYCSDGTQCDKANELAQTCKCGGNLTMDGNPSEEVTGYYRKCALTPSGHCNKCADGTACGQFDADGKICACEKTGKEGVYTGCQISDKAICKTCDDGTLCDEANDLGQYCKCGASWGSNNAASAYSTYCKMSQTNKCRACADGTACGQFNWKKELCTCNKTTTAGVYTECDLHGEATSEKICKYCDDGTICGESNDLGQYCKCRASWTENSDNVVSKYFTYCRLTLSDKCRACPDGTACGQVSSEGKVCACEKTSQEGIYTECKTYDVEICKGCADGTLCDQSNSDGSYCKCYAPWGSNNAITHYYTVCKTAK